MLCIMCSREVHYGWSLFFFHLVSLMFYWPVAASGCWFQCLCNEWRGIFGWSYKWRAILGWGSRKEQLMVLRGKVLSHFASHSLFVLSDPIGNRLLTRFSILLASSTLPFDLCPLLHQNSQKHNQLEKPSISWHPLVNVINVWLIFFLLPATPIAHVFHCRCSSSVNCSTCKIQ